MTNFRAEECSACGIPEYMHGGIQRWIDHGIPPGHFLMAVICNDLKEAAGRADEVNRHLLWNYVNYFYNYAPSPCWGSPDKAKAWAEREFVVASERESDG